MRSDGLLTVVIDDKRGVIALAFEIGGELSEGAIACFMETQRQRIYRTMERCVMLGRECMDATLGKVDLVSLKMHVTAQSAWDVVQQMTMAKPITSAIVFLTAFASFPEP